MQLQLFRHATHSLQIGSHKLLVDPMLGPAASMAAVSNSPNPRPNPLVEIPLSPSELSRFDAVVVTHTHRDHFDDEAARLLPKDLPLICQPDDEEKLRQLGFSCVHPVREKLEWQGITLVRTGGHHGTGDIGKAMAPVSGFIISAADEPRIYLTGDTIWCPEVAAVLERYQPDFTVVYGGGARFLEGDPITMTADDIIALCRHQPGTQVVVLHMEAFNHCLLTRQELQNQIKAHALTGQVRVPSDGETLTLV